MTSYIGREIQRYRLIQLLGHGSNAEVYLGQHRERGYLVAVKLLHAYITDETAKESFFEEARIIAKLVHPNIIQLLGYGFDETRPFVILSYASGGTLRERYPSGSRLAFDVVVSYVKELAEALDYAHSNQIIHCDIKPENILFDEKNNLLLSDFGTAAIVETTRLQRTQGPAGTAPYMAPEQFRGKPRPASDQYSLGVMVYEWLCGALPFQGKLFTEFLDQHLNEPPPSLRSHIPSLSSSIEKVVLRALEKDPKQRFETNLDFAHALQQANEQPEEKRILLPVRRLNKPKLQLTSPRIFDPLSQFRRSRVLRIGTVISLVCIILAVSIMAYASKPFFLFPKQSTILTSTTFSTAISHINRTATSAIMPLEQNYCQVILNDQNPDQFSTDLNFAIQVLEPQILSLTFLNGREVGAVTAYGGENDFLFGNAKGVAVAHQAYAVVRDLGKKYPPTFTYAITYDPLYTTFVPATKVILDMTLYALPNTRETCNTDHQPI